MSEKNATEWLENNIYGNITREMLDDQREKEIRGLDMM